MKEIAQGIMTSELGQRVTVLETSLSNLNDTVDLLITFALAGNGLVIAGLAAVAFLWIKRNNK